MDQYSHPEIENLMKDELNKKCFDCGNTHPKWASINNGIFVCLKCAGIHRSFGINVSFIRSLTIDSWDEKQILFLQKGGNKRYAEFLEEFKVPSNCTMDFKYMIRASDYYRKLLKHEVLGEDLPYKPDIISGLEMLEYGMNPYPSFDNLTPICSNNNNITVEGGDAEQLAAKKLGFFDSVGSFLNKAKDQVKSTAGKVQDKMKEYEVADKLKNAGTKTIGALKTGGAFVAEKSKEAYVKSFFFIFRTQKLFKKLHIKLKKVSM